MVFTNTSNKIDNKELKSMDFRDNIFNKSNEFLLDFVCNDNLFETYQLKVKKDDNFREVINRLKDKNPSLKGKNMKVFSYESRNIDQTETLKENGITNNLKIVIHN